MCACTSNESDISMSDGYLIPTFGGTPVVNKQVAQLYREITNDAFDLGEEEFITVSPILALRNDTTVAQTMVFEFDGYGRAHTFFDMGSLMLSADIKIVTQDDEKPAATVNASVVNNVLLSCFSKAVFRLNGVEIDVLDDFPNIVNLQDLFGTNDSLRKGVLKEGGMVFDQAEKFNPTYPGLPDPASPSNFGYTERQSFFCSVNLVAAAANFTWNGTPRTFMKHLNLPFSAFVPAAGNYCKIELQYSSNGWQHYIMAAKAEEGKKLKPYLSNLCLTIRTYSVDNNKAALEL